MNKSKFINYVYLIACGLLQGLIVVGSRYFSEQGLSLYEISILFPMPTILIFGMLILVNKKLRITREMLPDLMIYGIIFCFMILSQFGSVVMGTPVSLVVFLLYTQPLWTILLSKIFFKERITKRKLLSILLIILGVTVLFKPDGLLNVQAMIGAVIALAGGLSLSGWIVWGGVLNKKGYDDIVTSFCWSFFGAFFLLLSYPVISLFTSQTDLTSLSFSFDWHIWMLMFIYGFLTIGMGTLLYLKGIEKVNVSTAGMILLLEPISGAILALLFFHEPLGWNFIIGAGLILTANIVAIRSER